jgi:hypothetical protein
MKHPATCRCGSLHHLVAAVWLLPSWLIIAMAVTAATILPWRNAKSNRAGSVGRQTGQENHIPSRQS